MSDTTKITEEPKHKTDEELRKEATRILYEKIFNCILIWVGLGVFIYLVLHYLIWLTGLGINQAGENAVIGASVVVWCIFMYMTIPMFTLEVPSITGIITTNTWTGKQFWYQVAGLALIYPWERKDDTIIIGEEVIITSGKNPLDKKAESQTVSTKNGSVAVSYGFVMKTNVRDIKDALEFSRLDQAGRAAEFKQAIDLFIADHFITLDEEVALIGKKELSDKIVKFLTGENEKGTKLQREFRVRILNPEVYEVDLPEDIKSVRNQESIIPMRLKAMKKLFGKGDDEHLTEDQLKLAGTLTGANIGYNVTEIKGLEHMEGKPTANVLAAILAATTATMGKQGGKK